MAFNLGNLAGLGGLTQSSALLARQQQEAERLKIDKALQAIAMQNQQQQQQGMNVAGDAFSQIPPQPPPMAPLQGGGPDQLMGGGGGMPQPRQLGGGLASSLAAPGSVPLPKLTDEIYNLESGRGQNTSTSSAGAIGPMQIMPSTFKQYAQPGEDINDPNANRAVGGRIVGDLYNKYGGNPDLAAIAYNAGPGRADAIKKGAPLSSLPPETQNYLTKLHRDLDMDVGQKGVKMIQQGAPVPAVQETTSTAKQAGREIDPQQWGRSTIDDIKAAINKVAPDAPGIVKLIAAGQLSKLYAPEEKLQVQAYFRDRAQQIQMAMKELQIAQSQSGQAETHRHNIAEEEIGRTRAESDKGGQIFQSGDKFFRATPQGNVQPLDLPAGATKAGTQPRNAPAMALRTFMEEYQAREGHPPGSEEVRNFQATQAEAMSEARTIGTSSANLERASNAAAALIPLVRETSKQISRTQYPDINSLILAYETKTGDPKVVQYGEMVNSLRYTYARAMAPSGQSPRVADIQHFDEIFNKAWAEGQVDAALDQIERTIGIEKGATQKTKAEVLGKPDKGAAPSFPMMSREQIQQQLAPENWSKLTPEQQSAVARRVEELERGLK